MEFLRKGDKEYEGGHSLLQSKVAILGDSEKIRTRINGYVRDWYGYARTDERFICSKCRGSKKSHGLAKLFTDTSTVLIYQCECGNTMVSICHGIWICQTKTGNHFG